MVDREAAQVDTGPARQAHGVGLGSPWLYADEHHASSHPLPLRQRESDGLAGVRFALLAFASSKQRNEFGTNA